MGKFLPIFDGIFVYTHLIGEHTLWEGDEDGLISCKTTLVENLGGGYHGQGIVLVSDGLNLGLEA